MKLLPFGEADSLSVRFQGLQLGGKLRAARGLLFRGLTRLGQTDAAFEQGDHEACDSMAVEVVAHPTGRLAPLEQISETVDPLTEEFHDALAEPLILAGHLLSQIVQRAAVFAHIWGDALFEVLQQPRQVAHRVFHTGQRLNSHRLDQRPDLLFRS